MTVALSLSLNAANADNKAFFVPENVNDASAYTPVAVGKTLYTRYEGRWYRYTLESDGMTDIGAGAQALSPATGEMVSYEVFSDDRQLYGLCPQTGELWQLVESEDGFDASYLSTLDLSPFMGEDSHGFDPISLLWCQIYGSFRRRPPLPL